MCLIALALDRHPRFRLALIANRDELHARPSAAAGVDPEQPELYGGRDLVLGGSWLMVSRRGRLSAVTNVRAGLDTEEVPCSRGSLVRDFVAGGSSTETHLASLRDIADRFGRFNLLGWDGSRLGFASNHPEFQRHDVAAGIHAMSNGRFDAPWPKSGRATRALVDWLHAQPDQAPSKAGEVTAETLAPLWAALADTTIAPDPDLPDTGVGIALERRLSSAFILDPRYGTRCSSVVLVEDAAITFAERRFAPDGQITGESIERLETGQPRTTPPA